MRRNGFLIGGLLLLSCVSVRAQEQPALDLKAENELLRKERDAFESRMRLVQDELEDARRSATAARLEIDGLESRCKKLQEELKQFKGEQLAAILRNVVPEANAANGKSIRGKITGMSANLRTMQISLGQGAGLKEGQVLDVIRVRSEKGSSPLYLGTLRITHVDAHAALGQYDRVPGLDRAPKVGDEVSNELMVK